MIAGLLGHPLQMHFQTPSGDFPTTFGKKGRVYVAMMVSVCVYIYIYVCMYMYVYIYICIYVYIYIFDDDS